jgi:hypothetical protein
MRTGQLPRSNVRTVRRTTVCGHAFCTPACLFDAAEDKGRRNAHGGAAMKILFKGLCLATCATAVSIAGPAYVFAQQPNSNEPGSGPQNQDAPNEEIRIAAADRRGESSTANDLAEAYAKMRGEVISAEDLLDADVSNGLNPVGDVSDLVLTPDETQVQYILFETSYPYTLLGGLDGFASYDSVEFDQSFFDFTVLLDGEGPTNAPRELELTREQARHRLVSRLIGEPMQFLGNDVREIEDILLDKDTGAILHYVVATEMGSLLDPERRTIPAARVAIEDDGSIVAALETTEIESVQIYDPELL